MLSSYCSPSFCLSPLKCVRGSFSGRVTIKFPAHLSPILFSNQVNDRLSQPNFRRADWTASANGRLAQTRIDKPSANRSVPPGKGIKNDNASRPPTIFPSNLGSLISHRLSGCSRLTPKDNNQLTIDRSWNISLLQFKFWIFCCRPIGQLNR